MNKKTFVKVLALALVLAMIAPMAAVFAKSFPDVASDHWAYDPIDKLSNNNIINGYDDGLYRPDSYVKFLEVLKLIDGIIAPSAAERADAKAKFESVVRPYGVADWALDSVYTALNREVISEDTLKMAQADDLISGTTNEYPDRASIAIFYARALGMDVSYDFSVLKHDDVDVIRTDAKPFLVPLVKAGIFADTGSEGNFSGTRPIRRSEMAKITYLSYEYIKDHPITPEEPVEITVEGTILFKSSENNLKIIYADTGAPTNSTSGFIVDENTIFTLNGKAATFADVEAGQKVKITYVETQNDNPYMAKKVELTVEEVKGVGYVNSTGVNSLNISYTENTTGVDTNSTTKFKTDKDATFTTDASTVFTTYDKTTTLADIKANDMVEFTAENGVLKAVTVYPASYIVTGTLIDKTLSGWENRGTLKVRLSDNKDYTFYLLNSNEDVSKLIQNQRVTLNLNYKVIKSINTALSKDTIIGTVQNITIGNPQKIRIKDSTGLEKEYSIASNAEVIKGSKKYLPKEYYDLINETVQVESTAGIAEKITVLNTQGTFIITGTVGSINTENLGFSHTFNVKVETTNNSDITQGDELEVKLDGAIPFKQGDSVRVTGYFIENKLVTDTIVKINF